MYALYVHCTHVRLSYVINFYLLTSYRQALEQKCGYPGVFGDDSDASPNLLYQLDSHGVPCPRRLYGYETEDVGPMCRLSWHTLKFSVVLPGQLPPREC